MFNNYKSGISIYNNNYYQIRIKFIVNFIRILYLYTYCTKYFLYNNKLDKHIYKSCLVKIQKTVAPTFQKPFFAIIYLLSKLIYIII